jgi:hypothetical protein
MIDDELRKEVKRHFASGTSITEREVIDLMEVAQKRLIENAVVPIIEFFPTNPVPTPKKGDLHIFSPKADNNALSGLHRYLKDARGIYIFHDSTGHAIYAGKAEKHPLWSEINQAFNRSRGNVQSVWRVDPPPNYIGWKAPEKKQIKRVPVALHEIARYVSAYQVPTDLIGKFEALLIRSFANDLLNVRMEKL